MKLIAQTFDFRIKAPRILALIFLGMGIIMMAKAVWPDVKEAWIKAKNEVKNDG